MNKEYNFLDSNALKIVKGKKGDQEMNNKEMNNKSNEERKVMRTMNQKTNQANKGKKEGMNMNKTNKILMATVAGVMGAQGIMGTNNVVFAQDVKNEAKKEMAAPIKALPKPKVIHSDNKKKIEKPIKIETKKIAEKTGEDKK